MPNKEDLVPGYTHVATVIEVNNEWEPNSAQRGWMGRRQLTCLEVKPESLDPTGDGTIWVLEVESVPSIVVLRLLEVHQTDHHEVTDTLWEVVKEGE